MMTREDPATAGVRVVARSRRRWGGYLVHVGIVIAFAGFAGSAYNEEEDADLRLGESTEVAGLEFIYEGIEEYDHPTYEGLKASLLLREDGKSLARLFPEFRFFKTADEQRHTRVAILSGFRRDVYVYLAGVDGDVLSVDIRVNPLVSWVWGGGLITVAGCLIAIWPARRRTRAALGVYGEGYVPDDVRERASA